VTNEQLDSLVERLLPQLTQQLAKGASPAPNAGRKHGNQSRTKGSSLSDATSDKDSSSDSSVTGTAPAHAAAPVPVPAGSTPASPAAGPSYAYVVADAPPAIAPEAAAGVPASKLTPGINKPELRRNPPRGSCPNPEGGGRHLRDLAVASAQSCILPARGPYAASDEWLQRKGFNIPDKQPAIATAQPKPNRGRAHAPSTQTVRAVIVLALSILPGVAAASPHMGESI
jgi:hypothetical protein